MNSSRDLGWSSLPGAAKVYVAFVTTGGLLLLAALAPRSYPDPVLFGTLLVLACVTAAWKVNLPIALASGSTLSVSCAAKLMALLLLGPQPAIVVAVAGALTQCTYKVRQRYPLYRTLFSMAAEAVAMAVTGAVYVTLGGTTPPFDVAVLARPLVAAIVTYFIVDTAFVAVAIAATTDRSSVGVWRDDFLWSGVGFMVAGAAGAVAALIVAGGYHWIAVLLLAPLYVTYRTYARFMGRLEAQTTALSNMTKLEEVRKQLLLKEHEARESAEQANRLKDQFLAIVSHELRTPLNAILGWSDMLRGGRLEGERRDRAFTAIHDSALRQSQLIDELLDVARIMSGKLQIERSFVALEDVVHAAVNVVQPTADAKRVELRFEIHQAISVIYGDRIRLQQIVWNLLSNAIKFTPSGGTVHVQLGRADGAVDLVVSDSGPGIPSEFLPSLFKPFRQADGSTTRQQPGLGLGLSIVKHLAEAHGGTVSADCGGNGRGASFTVRLPIAPASAEQAEIAMATRPSLSTRWSYPPDLLGGLRVLVVDDDEQGRQVVAAQLEQHGASVMTAASAAEGLDLLLRERVDVLLADIAMPNEDGYTLIRRLRTLYPSRVASVPAAALTAFARTEDRIQALQAGFELHLAKPIDPQALVTGVARLARRVPDARHAGHRAGASLMLH